MKILRINLLLNCVRKCHSFVTEIVSSLCWIISTVEKGYIGSEHRCRCGAHRPGNARTRLPSYMRGVGLPADTDTTSTYTELVDRFPSVRFTDALKLSINPSKTWSAQTRKRFCRYEGGSSLQRWKKSSSVERIFLWKLVAYGHYHRVLLFSASREPIYLPSYNTPVCVSKANNLPYLVFCVFSMEG